MKGQKSFLLFQIFSLNIVKCDEIVSVGYGEGEMKNSAGNNK